MLTNLQLQLWDTAGLERTSSLTPSYFHGSKAVLFIYDTTTKSTASDLIDWYQTTDQQFKDQTEKPLYFVIGTKCDDNQNQQISIDEVKDKLKDKTITKYFVVSSKTGKGFEQCEKEITECVFRRGNGTVPDGTDGITKDPNKKSICEDCVLM